MAAAVGFLLLAVFQVVLALGAPWGRAAWGGAHERLPTGLRIASVFAALFWMAAAVAMLARAGHEVIPLPTIGDWLPWTLFGFLVLGTLMNLASRSRLERLIQSPIAAVLAVLCLLVALGT